MTINRILVVLVCAVCLSIIISARSQRNAVGTMASEIMALDLQGKMIDLTQHESRPSPATVLVFTRTDCPIARRYAPRLTALAENCAKREVNFWLVFPIPSDTPEEIRPHAQEYKLPEGHIVRDVNGTLVRRFHAEVTPEAVVLDRRGQVQYQGRIDDRHQDYGKARAAASSDDLVNALEAVLQHRPVREAKTKAIGCPLPSTLMAAERSR